MYQLKEFKINNENTTIKWQIKILNHVGKKAKAETQTDDQKAQRIEAR
jgi:hypothetical protein